KLMKGMALRAVWRGRIEILVHIRNIRWVDAVMVRAARARRTIGMMHAIAAHERRRTRFVHARAVDLRHALDARARRPAVGRARVVRGAVARGATVDERTPGAMAAHTYRSARGAARRVVASRRHEIRRAVGNRGISAFGRRAGHQIVILETG